MRKFLSIAFIFTCLMANFTLSSYAVSTERGYISINSSASKEVTPDVADITFSIKTYDSKSLQKASASNKEVSNHVYHILKGMLDTNSGEYIKTADFHASPIYTYSGNKRILDKYEVSNRITVHTKSLEKLGIMIDKSIEAGATNVDSINFSISNYEELCNDLIETASQKAKSRANIAAKGLSATLDGIRSLDISYSDGSYGMPRTYLAKNTLSLSTEDSAAGTTISTGNIKIQVNVNASFFVK